MSDMTNNGGQSSPHPGPKGKVAKVMAELEMEEIGDELVRSWTGQGAKDRSLRELANYFNREVIEESLRVADADPLSGEIESIFEGLTADSISESRKQDIRGRLDRKGIDVETLEARMVSYQAIRTYLKNERGVEAPKSESNSLKNAKLSIQRLIGRLQSVTEHRLETLESGDHITVGDHRVLINVLVYCDECDRQFDIEQLLEQGGCECSSVS